MFISSLFYIDPGTGSMLFTVLIGLISAGIYALRNALIKLRFVITGGKKEKTIDSAHAITIFSDGKQYWNVFEPICNELERRGVIANYLTASPDDPALSKHYENISCSFAGEGNKAFAKLNMLKSDIVLATTPGLEVYQWKRSRDVKYYVHVLHAASDASMYRMFGLDYYDAVLLSGEFQVKQVRELERLRNLPAKELEIVGLTYMDALANKLKEAGSTPEHDTTVLLAPSWGKSAIFSLYGGTIIEKLLETGYHIIVRPHPQSFKSEAELLEKIMTTFPESEQLEWNQDVDNFEVLRRSDIMISDFSGVIFDFALVFDKPIIYTEPSFDSAPYDACWLADEPWTYSVLPSIGHKLSLSNSNLREIIDNCITDSSLQVGRENARKACWQNQGNAAEAAVDYLQFKLEQLNKKPSEEDTTNQDSNAA